MKELIKSVPLLLFLSLLLILSISIYFGGVKKYANLEGHTSNKSCDDDDECDETNTNGGDNKQFVDDLKIIMSTIAGTARNSGPIPERGTSVGIGRFSGEATQELRSENGKTSLAKHNM